MKKEWTKWLWLLPLLTFCVYGCTPDNPIGGLPEGEPFDPAYPAKVTSFTPETGSAFQQMLIYGENFGYDESLIEVKVGGNNAAIVSSVGTVIYCYVPNRAFSGIVELWFGKGYSVDSEMCLIDETGNRILGEDGNPIVEPRTNPAGYLINAQGGFIFDATGSRILIPETSHILSAEGRPVFDSQRRLIYRKANPTDEDVLVKDKDGQPIVDNNRQMITVPTPFKYTSEWLVSTVCGYRNQNDSQGWRDGHFSEFAGFRGDSAMNFDPMYPSSHLYVVFDGGGGRVQKFDLENETVTTVFSANGGLLTGANDRARSVDFTMELPKHNKAKGQYMVVTVDNNTGNTTPSVWLVERNANGEFDNTSNSALIASYKQCNGAAIHPINGELYFNSYDKGQVFRVDLNDYFDAMASGEPWVRGAFEAGTKIEQLFTIADPNWEFKIFIHPTGDYAYLQVINQHYILRTDYNWETKRFVNPYVVSGGYKISGYKDGVGTVARMNHPYQGVFVKNNEYPEGEDQYDFYFTDETNHCVRKLSPTGILSTYAGRGSASQGQDGNWWGVDDGTLRGQARFRDPFGIAYDEANEALYVATNEGRTLRKISRDTE